MPCPLDPSHTVRKDCLEKHVMICPAAIHAQQQQNQPYYIANINKGGHGALKLNSVNKTRSSMDTSKWAQQLALTILQVHQRVFAKVHTNNIQDPCTITSKEIYGALPMADLSQPELQAGVEEALQHYRIKSGGPRHVRQQASLIGHLRRIDALTAGADNSKSRSTDPPPSRVILEVGAGRGMLGLIVAGVSAADGSATRLVMVERDGTRSKADTVLRRGGTTSTPYLDLRSVGFDRIRCDLAHVDLSTSATIAAAHDIVVVAKHLCGAGTDLALRSLEPIRDRVSYCVFATCCHGVCNWDDYVGRDFLSDIMRPHGTDSFGQEEFELMRVWSSGSVLVDGETQVRPSASEEHCASCSASDRSPMSLHSIVEALHLRCKAQGLGRACQRLIDFGRQEYLRKVLFRDAHVELLHYVGSKTTPQNAVLIASSCGSFPRQENP